MLISCLGNNCKQLVDAILIDVQYMVQVCELCQDVLKEYSEGHKGHPE